MLGFDLRQPRCLAVPFRLRLGPRGFGGWWPEVFAGFAPDRSQSIPTECSRYWPSMTRMAEGSEVEMFCRNNLTICAKTMAFFPDSLDDQTMAQTQLKRATFGAIFNGHRVSLPQSAEYGVIWEVTLDKNPPAQIKALKPKFWLKGKLPMKADHVYKIG